MEFSRLDNARRGKAGNLRIDRAQHGELTEDDLVGRKRNERPARHGVDGDEYRDLCRMRLHRTSDLHSRQHQAAGRMQHEVDRHLRRRFLDRGDDGLGVLQIDVS